MDSGIVAVATIAGEWFPYDRCDAEIELKFISAIVVAAIAGEWFPNDRYHR